MDVGVSWRVCCSSTIREDYEVMVGGDSRMKHEGEVCLNGLYGACYSSKERERDLVNDGGGGEIPLAVVVEFHRFLLPEK